MFIASPFLAVIIASPFLDEKGPQDSAPGGKKKREKKGPLAHLHLINYLTERIKIDLDGEENKSASGLLALGVEVRT